MSFGHFIVSFVVSKCFKKTIGIIINMYHFLQKPSGNFVVAMMILTFGAKSSCF